MMKVYPKPLRSNPYSSYRDPKTGRWLIVKPLENSAKMG